MQLQAGMTKVSTQAWEFSGLETIVIATVSFPKNVNDGNDNSFPHHFSSNVIISTLGKFAQFS